MICSCLLPAAGTVNAQQVEPDVSYEITPEMELEGTTGIPQQGEDSVQAMRVAVGDGIVYDYDRMMYGYAVGQAYLYSNVIDGMIVQGNVEISHDDGVEYTVYRESEPLDTQDSSQIVAPGSYTVMTGDEGFEKKLFSFRIIGTAISEPLSYALPSGCIASSMQIDGEEALTNNRVFDFSQEGNYLISYQCVRNNQAYSMDFTVDHTAPVLTFDGVENKKARGEVTIQGMEEGDQLEIHLDGEVISSRTTLTQPGQYQVKVADKAGNASVYSFYILFYLNAGGISAGAIVGVVILALVIYLFIARKRLRVR